jgi:hypothetical protein
MRYLLCSLAAFVAPDAAYGIPITVLNTHEVTWASNIQDIAMNWDEDLLIARSNGDGKLYLVDPASCTVQGQVDLPAGIDGFGVAWGPWSTGGRYYVDWASESLVYHSDGADTWASFPNPAGSGGGGMDINWIYGLDSDLYQASSQSPHLFYGTDRGNFSWDSWGLPGISGEVSGFMVHEVATLNGYPPFALIAATRFTHQFHFFWQPPNYILYGQEDCPLPVEESLGLAWFMSAGTVLWSWKGTDGKYYISELLIPVFGDIENSAAAMTISAPLSVNSNPARGFASITVNLSEQASASLTVFDAAGRHVRTLISGRTPPGAVTCDFTGPSGVYMARLEHPGGSFTLRFVLSD